MEERELPSESEESDEDYVPSGGEGQLSEEESDGDVEEGRDEGSGGEGKSETSTNTRKRQKNKSKKLKSRKKARVESPVEGKEETPSPEETEEEKKRKADTLWAMFKQDTEPLSKPLASQSGQAKQELPEKSGSDKKKKNEDTSSRVKSEPATTTVTKVFEFAGEKVEVTEEIKAATSALRGKGFALRGRGGSGSGVPSRAGLANVLGNLGKKNRLSTLEKSKLDWESFKNKKGLQEEIQTHNKGKQGYLERQDFLQRADLRQFEIEKSMRSTIRRSNR